MLLSFFDLLAFEIRVKVATGGSCSSWIFFVLFSIVTNLLVVASFVIAFSFSFLEKLWTLIIIILACEKFAIKTINYAILPSLDDLLDSAEHLLKLL